MSNGEFVKSIVHRRSIEWISLKFLSVILDFRAGQSFRKERGKHSTVNFASCLSFNGIFTIVMILSLIYNVLLYDIFGIKIQHLLDVFYKLIWFSGSFVFYGKIWISHLSTLIARWLAAHYIKIQTSFWRAQNKCNYVRSSTNSTNLCWEGHQICGNAII